MKKVIRGQELETKMIEAIDLLCDTVKTTLGPKGSNAIIDHSSFSPFITNDGVTIAQNIESEDAIINTFLELAKEASIATDEKVGDGTTTTLVLLQGLFKNGLALIKQGMNPIFLKKELDSGVEELIEKIKEMSRMPKEDDLKNIACISGGSLEIGYLISEAFNLVKNKEAINIQIGTDDKTTLTLKKGYTLDTGLVSLYYFKDQNEINITNARILLLKDCLENLEEIANIINEIIRRNEKLIIIADDYSDELINEIMSLYLNNEAQIYLIKIPGYGEEKLEIFADLEIITNSKSSRVKDYLTFEVVGTSKQVIIKKEEITFQFTEEEKIKEYIEKLKTGINNNPDLKGKRLAMLDKGIVNLIIGGYTETERREKKMRFIDALEAISSLDLGIVPGSGIVLAKIAETIKEGKLLYFKETLKLPLEQIIENAGLEKEPILKEIEKNNYQFLYNVSTGIYEDINSTKVVDSTKVVINSLINATSIAGILLTTTSLIINEYPANLIKNNDYNEI